MRYIITVWPHVCAAEDFPVQGLHHCCDSASLVVVIGDKSSSAALSSFSVSYVDVRMWVPNSCCIIQLGPGKCLVAIFLDVLGTGRNFLRRKVVILLAFLVTVFTCAFQERLSLIRTSRYFAFSVCPSSLPCMVYLASIGFLFLLIRITSHLSGLNDMSQSFSHCSRASRPS